jgi:hypothetical protein
MDGFGGMDGFGRELGLARVHQHKVCMIPSRNTPVMPGYLVAGSRRVAKDISTHHSKVAEPPHWDTPAMLPVRSSKAVEGTA